MGYIDSEQLKKLIRPLQKTGYGKYLKNKVYENTKTNISGLVIIEPRVFYDSRGYFFEPYNKYKFDKLINETNFIQDNESKSTRGVLRDFTFRKHHLLKLSWLDVLREQF